MSNDGSRDWGDYGAGLPAVIAATASPIYQDWLQYTEVNRGCNSLYTENYDTEKYDTEKKEYAQHHPGTNTRSNLVLQYSMQCSARSTKPNHTMMKPTQKKQQPYIQTNHSQIKQINLCTRHLQIRMSGQGSGVMFDLFAFLTLPRIHFASALVAMDAYKWTIEQKLKVTYASARGLFDQETAGLIAPQPLQHSRAKSA